MSITTIYDEGGEIEKSINEREIQLGLERSNEETFRTKELWEYMLDENDKLAIKEGDMSVDAIFEFLEKIKRSDNQKEFHQAFVISSLRLIYGSRFKQERYRIQKKYGWDFPLRQQTIISCPRRGGKSFATAQYVTTAALYIFPDNMMINNEDRGVIISVFSPSKRQSVMLINHIYSMIELLGVLDRVVRKTEEKIYILNYRGKVAQINAYPSVVRTLKGVNGDILILEEMAQIPDDVLYKVIMPLFQLDQTCLICISTLLDDENTMTGLLRLTDDDGQQIFNTKEIFMSCEKCRAKGKSTSCTHNSHNITAWQSQRKHNFIKHIMKENKETYEQEIGGITHSLNEKIIKEKYIEQLKTQERYNFDPLMPRYECVYVCLDPSGNGKKSEIAITSMIRYRGQFIIIGLESFSGGPYQGHAVLVEHCRTIRRNTLFKACKLIFILENNLGNEADHYATSIENNLTNYWIVSNPEKNLNAKNSHIGCRTTATVKMMGVEQLIQKIKERALFFAGNNYLISLTRSNPREGTQPAIDFLLAQMRNFSKIVKENDVKKASYELSGKHKGCDDLFVTLILVTYWSNYVVTNPLYEPYIM